MTAPTGLYAARLDIDYPEKLDRVSTAFRIIWIIPIAIVLSVLSAYAVSSTTVVTRSGEVFTEITRTGGGIAGALFLATLLMILFRQRYPRWWFDFALQFHRFSARVGAYAALLSDRYPSTVDEQSVHLDIDYPDAEHDLNRWLPLVKWLLVIPHLIVLFFLFIGAFFAVVIAWFAILFTGRYPRGLFNYVVGVGRWALRVTAYATLLVTDRYQPSAPGCAPTSMPPARSPRPRRRPLLGARAADTSVVATDSPVRLPTPGAFAGPERSPPIHHTDTAIAANSHTTTRVSGSPGRRVVGVRKNGLITTIDPGPAAAPGSVFPVNNHPRRSLVTTQSRRRQRPVGVGRGAASPAVPTRAFLRQSLRAPGDVGLDVPIGPPTRRRRRGS